MTKPITIDLLYGLTYRNASNEEVKYQAKINKSVESNEDIHAEFNKSWDTLERQVMDRISLAVNKVEDKQ